MTKSRHLLTPEQRAKIVELYNDGVSPPAIAERFGISNDAPARLAKEKKANAQVAQSVEHSTENAGVGGSIPPLGTN